MALEGGRHEYGIQAALLLRSIPFEVERQDDV